MKNSEGKLIRECHYCSQIAIQKLNELIKNFQLLSLEFIMPLDSEFTIEEATQKLNEIGVIIQIMGIRPIVEIRITEIYQESSDLGMRRLPPLSVEKNN